MSEVLEFLQRLAQELSGIDVLDILIVSYLFYKLLQLIRGGRASQMVVGTVVPIVRVRRPEELALVRVLSVRPEEIAAMAAFLASPAGAYVRGQSIAVDGGRLRGI